MGWEGGGWGFRENGVEKAGESGCVRVNGRGLVAGGGFTWRMRWRWEKGERGAGWLKGCIEEGKG